MASIHKRGGRYIVRYRDLDGRERGYTPPAGTRRAALAIRREIDECHARGQDWISPATRARRAPTLEAGLSAFVDARRPMVSPGYVRQIEYALGGFVQSVDDSDGDRAHPVSVMSKSRLTRYFSWLREVREVSRETARERVRHVERAWVWLADDDEWGPHVSRPRRLELKAGPRSIGQDAPRWEQMDAAINAARVGGDWMWRMMFLASRTGLRARSQIMRLKWADLDMRRALLRIRPELGKSRQERRGRTVPVAPVVMEVIAWPRDGIWLVSMPGAKRHPDFNRIPGFWAAAELDPQDLPWQPLHGVRKGFVSGLARAGVQERVACFLTGHQRPGDVHTTVYTASDALRDLAREAVALIPPLASMPAPKPAEPEPCPEGIVVPVGGRIDWDAQPLELMSDTAIAKALTAAGVRVTRPAVRYHRCRRGIPAFRGPTAPKGIDWSRVDWGSYAGMTLVEVGERLGCIGPGGGPPAGHGGRRSGRRRANRIADRIVSGGLLDGAPCGPLCTVCVHCVYTNSGVKRRKPYFFRLLYARALNFFVYAEAGLAEGGGQAVAARPGLKRDAGSGLFPMLAQDAPECITDVDRACPPRAHAVRSCWPSFGHGDDALWPRGSVRSSVWPLQVSPDIR